MLKVPLHRFSSLPYTNALHEQELESGVGRRRRRFRPPQLNKAMARKYNGREVGL